MVAAQPVVGVFETRAQAERALAELEQAGFRPDQLGVVVRDGLTETSSEARVLADTAPEEGAAVGAITGGTVGGLIGALLATTIPGVGPALAAGILAGVLGGATLGATGGGLVGALVGLGLSTEEASYYEQEFRSGRVLVTVRAAGREGEASRILARCGALARPPAARA